MDRAVSTSGSRGTEAHTRAQVGERVPEKSHGLLRQGTGVAARYQLLLEEKAEFLVFLMAPCSK